MSAAKLARFELPNRLVRNEETATDTYAQFSAEPFERGYGHTIGNTLRRVLLSHARTLSLLDRCPAKEVARIEKGTGARDVANDLADLAALYLAHDLVIAGGTVQTGQVRRAEVLGAALIEKIRPASAVRPSRRTADQQSAMALRDRVWTLFVRAYEHIELAAGAVWGRHVNKHLPSLQARAVARKATTKTAAPTG